MPATGPQKEMPHLHFVSTSAKCQAHNYVTLQLDSMNFYSYKNQDLLSIHIQTSHCSLPLAPNSKQIYVSNWENQVKHAPFKTTRVRTGPCQQV